MSTSVHPHGTDAQQGKTPRATAQTRSTCPDWCGLDEHDPWTLGSQGLERDHTVSLLRDTEGVSVDVVGVEQLVLHFNDIEAGARISEAHHYERPVPVVQLDMPPQGVDLGAAELRRLISALSAASLILEADMASADPLDETNKADRVDGGGCIWEWDAIIRMWVHAGEELVPSTTLAFIDEVAGPIGFLGAR